MQEEPVSLTRQTHKLLWKSVWHCFDCAWLSTFIHARTCSYAKIALQVKLVTVVCIYRCHCCRVAFSSFPWIFYNWWVVWSWAGLSTLAPININTHAQTHLATGNLQLHHRSTQSQNQWVTLSSRMAVNSSQRWALNVSLNGCWLVW